MNYVFEIYTPYIDIFSSNHKVYGSQIDKIIAHSGDH